jgi:hypothetical protein
LALIASAHPELRVGPAGLVKFPKKSAVTPVKLLTNATPPLSATAVSNTDLTGAACPGLLPPGPEGDQGEGGLRRRLVSAAEAVAGGAAGP